MENTEQKTQPRRRTVPALIAVAGILIGGLGVSALASGSPVGAAGGVVLATISVMTLFTATIRGALHGWFGSWG